MNHSAAGRPRSFFSLINFAFIADRRTTFAITRVFIYLSRHNNTAFIHHFSQSAEANFSKKEIKKRSEPLCPAGGPKCATSADTTHGLRKRERALCVSTKSNSPAAAESEGKRASVKFTLAYNELFTRREMVLKTDFPARAQGARNHFRAQ